MSGFSDEAFRLDGLWDAPDASEAVDLSELHHALLSDHLDDEAIAELDAVDAAPLTSGLSDLSEYASGLIESPYGFCENRSDHRKAYGDSP
jgi:hypothetical protein